MSLKNIIAPLLLGACLHTGTSHAAAFVLDFEGAGDFASLNNFYNGGTDSQGHSGTNYGVGFGSNALSLIDSDAGGTGNFANEPSANTAMFFTPGSAILNYAPGFITGFSFFYSSTAVASVKVWDDQGATGSLLATLNLVAQANSNCTGDPAGFFCNWTAVGATFSGTAKSVSFDFSGAPSQSIFDDITFGSANAGQTGRVPEPASLALLALGLLGMRLPLKKSK